jgi:uncharacterized protein (TIGR02996 family)
MLSLRDALESALVENPDDLAAHYAYADYLQEQGDPRGEFIQVQLALEDPQRSEAERRKLQTRAKELLGENERAWLGTLVYNPGLEYHFVRGWLDTLIVRDVGDDVHRADAELLLYLAPAARLLRKLILEYDDGLVEAVLRNSPSLRNVQVFQLGGSRGAMPSSPLLPELIAKLPRIEELRLFAQGYDAAHLFALSNISSLRILQVYYLNDRYPLEVLADNSALRNLTHLLLHPCSFEEPCIDATGIRAIVHSQHLRNLIHLQLHCSDLGDVGCTEIVTSGILKRLKILDLRHGEITDTGARILADCPDLRRLKLLDIERNALTQTGINMLRRVLGPALRVDNQQTAEELAQRQYLYEEDFA